MGSSQNTLVSYPPTLKAVPGDSSLTFKDDDRWDEVTLCESTRPAPAHTVSSRRAERAGMSYLHTSDGSSAARYRLREEEIRRSSGGRVERDEESLLDRDARQCGCGSLRRQCICGCFIILVIILILILILFVLPRTGELEGRSNEK
ncbi:hypothetical protein DFP72DRAFT_839545 [Ephemerocybe angulata]|uniref:Uncharacterized protein n=1 Tax=Ephemerocybe angulata TaxID=980116 RepID=A0A8H6IHV0_9AGAR|nr:hypothetical protein DFP72DRAFT_839545 [Tulosesus angulatus]